MEHTSIIWHQIQAAKKDKRDIHVIFLDLANAFGSVPHNLLWESCNFFHVPSSVTSLVKAYFEDLQLCFTTAKLPTSWQCIELGIMAACTILPLAFTMAMEVIIRASRWVEGGERTKNWIHLPPIQAYMDDMTTLNTTAASTRRLLGKLQENIKWAQMKIKPNKSRRISIVKGQLKNVKFCIGDDPIQQCRRTLSKASVQYNLSKAWASAASKAGHHRQSGKHQQDPTAREAQALVSAIWTSPSGNVATHYLRAPNNNCGEDGANHDFICEEMARRPTLSD